jgi:DNA repair protein RecN (Recombination protein N)
VGGAGDAGGRAASRLREAERLDERLTGPRSLVEQAGDLLADAVRELERYADRLEFDPGRLEEIQARLHAIERLKRKYGPSVEAILAHGAAVGRELEELAAAGETLPQREAEWQALQRRLAAQAEALSATRAKAARNLERQVAAELKDLGFARAGFQVQVARAEGADPIGPTGQDVVEFLFAPNPGEEPKPLHKIASGGELSRTMLAIKAILARADRVPTLIFDEVDAGIGGAMADVVGRKLYGLAEGRQVLCVTHLPQIAALADGHYHVIKQTARGATTTQVHRLEADRDEEIARMLGGRQDASIPLEHARQILASAKTWKRRAGKRD